MLNIARRIKHAKENAVTNGKNKIELTVTRKAISTGLSWWSRFAVPPETEQRTLSSPSCFPSWLSSSSPATRTSSSAKVRSSSTEKSSPLCTLTPRNSISSSSAKEIKKKKEPTKQRKRALKSEPCKNRNFVSNVRWEGDMEGEEEDEEGWNGKKGRDGGKSGAALNASWKGKLVLPEIFYNSGTQSISCGSWFDFIHLPASAMIILM